MANGAVMLTTIDNPWSPFDNYLEWSNYDVIVGNYNSSGLLARMSECMKQQSDNETEPTIEEVIDQIIADDPFNVFEKVRESDYSAGVRKPHTPGVS